MIPNSRRWCRSYGGSRTLEVRKKTLVDLQQYAAEQQYYVYLFSVMITSSWQPYLKNYSHNLTFDYGSRIAVAWLER